MIDVDGSGLRHLIDSAGLPVWSPDGLRIAFVSDRESAAGIYVVDADGSGVTGLTNSPAIDRTLAWSPDGARIAFKSDRDGQTEIYVMNADGSDQTRLTRNFGHDHGGTWSPDGAQLVFSSNRAAASRFT